VLALQPFREIAHGRAALGALDGPRTALSALDSAMPNTPVHVAGRLEAASDGRRERPIELLAPAALSDRRTEFVLAPGTLLADEGASVTLEGSRFELDGSPADYPFGAPAAVYGVPRGGAIEAWAIARDIAGLGALADRQMTLLRWPWLLLGLVLAAIGYLLALAAAYALARAAGRANPPTPHLAGIAVALYWIVGFGLLGSAWAMLWPMICGAVGTAVAAVLLARYHARVAPFVGATAPPSRRRRRR
jgi:hypothetical protein